MSKEANSLKRYKWIIWYTFKCKCLQYIHYFYNNVIYNVFFFLPEPMVISVGTIYQKMSHAQQAVPLCALYQFPLAHHTLDSDLNGEMKIDRQFTIEMPFCISACFNVLHIYTPEKIHSGPLHRYSVIIFHSDL